MTSLDIPNLFIVGAAKSGTTTLYDIFSGHQDIFTPEVKEPFYYTSKSREIIKDNELKKRIFYKYDDYIKLYSNAGGTRYSADFSTTYLYNSKEFIQSLTSERGCIKSVKVIVILRKPLERAISHYKMMKQFGLESLPIEKALKRSTCNKRKNIRWGYDYIGFSEYGEQLRNIENAIEKSNLLVLNFDEFKNEPEKFLHKIADFLDITPFILSRVNKSNESYDVGNKFLARILFKLSGFARAYIPKGKFYDFLLKMKVVIQGKNKRRAEQVKKENLSDIEKILENDKLYVKRNYDGFENW